MSFTSEVRLPENIIFVGAGFSRNAGGLTTFDLSNKIKEFIKDNKPFPSVDKILKDKNNELNNILKIDTLKKISEIIIGDDNSFLANLFSLLDYNLEKKKGLKVKDKYFDVDELYKAKKTFEFLIQKSMYESFKENIKEFEHYWEFCKCLQQYMINEHYEKIVKYNPADPEYYMSSLGVVTLNWDGIVFLEMMKLNNEFNHRSTDVGLYLDFGELILKRKDKYIFSMNESSVQRNNKNKNNKPYRIMKYLAAHGMFGTRVCPHCGVYFADFDDFKNEHYDLLAKNFMKCPNCGTMTSIINAPLYYQSYVDRRFVYLIEKWEEETINILRKAKRYIFIGYSFPEDDLQMRNIMFNVFSDGEKRKAYVIDYSENNKGNRWYSEEEARKIFKDKEILINKYTGIFGKENVKFNFSGGLKAFLAGEGISCEMINEVLKGKI
ncbi:hypothetical protein SAMN02745164_02045 [Marinitoga hydrogenitolerans DSM 16785]|uniref:Uncharacterized protein n=1 Tax=Marinitoga hydrogenitolerans (strain DSM 16785 / JCM 12826 / AT1271) TaxID=1122195 RepID=A0A1M4ZYM1_MARH1|nr:hypothetical protein [Marinitoga hydrogenitolerans]SHF22736.1 hypothetical protein SAMN02745164_02045 [Marinitoga hydrogenitolerans DSM 16785]